MSESKLQSKIRKDLQLNGWKVIKIMLTEPGNPDLLAGKNGVAIWIEVKDQGKEPEPLQLLRHEEWRDHGFQVFVLDTWDSYLEVRKQLV